MKKRPSDMVSKCVSLMRCMMTTSLYHSCALPASIPKNLSTTATKPPINQASESDRNRISHDGLSLEIEIDCLQHTLLDCDDQRRCRDESVQDRSRDQAVQEAESQHAQ